MNGTYYDIPTVEKIYCICHHICRKRIRPIGVEIYHSTKVMVYLNYYAPIKYKYMTTRGNQTIYLFLLSLYLRK